MQFHDKTLERTMIWHKSWRGEEKTRKNIFSWLKIFS